MSIKVRRHWCVMKYRMIQMIMIPPSGFSFFFSSCASPPAADSTASKHTVPELLVTLAQPPKGGCDVA